MNIHTCILDIAVLEIKIAVIAIESAVKYSFV